MTETVQLHEELPTEAGSWLLADKQRSGKALDGVVGSAPPAHRGEGQGRRLLTKVAKAALVDEVADALRQCLGDRIGDVLAEGLRSHERLLGAARETLGDPGSQRSVEVGAYEISTEREPKLDLFVDDVRIAELNAEYKLVVLVAQAVAVVRDGRLVAFRTGKSTVSGVINVESCEVAKRSFSFDLATQVDLRDGIPLVRRHPSQVSARP